MNLINRRDFITSLAVTCAAGAAAAETAVTAAEKGQALPRRPLGKTGARPSILALGGVIGMQLAPSNDQDPAALAEAALGLGVTYFDTSPDYNNGQSEKNYGRVMARRRKEVFLATKTNERTYDGTMRSIEQSLQRLQTDNVDLLQIHGVSANEDLVAWGKSSGVIAALQKLKDQKVIRFMGLTGHEDAAILKQAIERYDFDTLLTTLNPVNRRRQFRQELLPAANEKGMGVIAMKVMGGGNGCLVIGNPLQKVLRPYHDQTAQQARAPLLLRYTLSLPVSVAVVGVASIEQLKANVATATEFAPLAASEREQLERQMA